MRMANKCFHAEVNLHRKFLCTLAHVRCDQRQFKWGWPHIFFSLWIFFRGRILCLLLHAFVLSQSYTSCIAAMSLASAPLATPAHIEQTINRQSGSELISQNVFRNTTETNPNCTNDSMGCVCNHFEGKYTCFHHSNAADHTKILSVFLSFSFIWEAALLLLLFMFGFVHREHVRTCEYTFPPSDYPNIRALVEYTADLMGERAFRSPTLYVFSTFCSWDVVLNGYLASQKLPHSTFFHLFLVI